MPMGRGRSNLIQPGFETTGCSCMAEMDLSGGSSDLSTVCHSSYMKDTIYRCATCICEVTRDTTTTPYVNLEIWLRVLIHSFAFAHTRLVTCRRIGLRAKTLLPIRSTSHSTSPYAYPFITSYTIPLRQRSRMSWRTDLRNTPDYPTMGSRLGTVHLPFITLALLASFHTPDVPSFLRYW